MPRGRKRWALAALLVVLGSAENAHAYLDPGTGSIILQAVIGGVAVGLLVLKRQWRAGRAPLRKATKRTAGDERAGP
jgi:hypothetical protein